MPKAIGLAEVLLTPGRNSLRMVGHIIAMGNWLKSERVKEWVVVPNESSGQHNLARGRTQTKYVAKIGERWEEQ